MKSTKSYGFTYSTEDGFGGGFFASKTKAVREAGLVAARIGRPIVLHTWVDGFMTTGQVVSPLADRESAVVENFEGFEEYEAYEALTAKLSGYRLRA